MLEKKFENNNMNESELNASAINTINKSAVNRSLTLTPIKIKKEFRGSFIDIEKNQTLNLDTFEKNIKKNEAEKTVNSDSLSENFTVIFIGPKEVGKSSLINRILNKGFSSEYDETILDPYCCERLYEIEEKNDKTKNKKGNLSKNNNNYNSLYYDNFDGLENFKLDFSFENIKEKQKDEKLKNEKAKEGYTFRIIDTGDFDTYQKDIEDLFKICNSFVFVYSIENIKSFKKIKEIYFKIQEKIKDVKNLILVGNKNDLNINRNVSFFEAVEFAESNNMKFLEASAKDDINVHKVFQTFIDIELKRNKKKEVAQKIEKEKFCEMKENNEKTNLQENENPHEFALEKTEQQAEHEFSASPHQEYDDINVVKKDNKEISNKESSNIDVKSINESEQENGNPEKLLGDNLPLSEIQPWEFASTYPERVIKGTEVKIYPFPNDITKEEIYENFHILGDIIDVEIIPVSKDGKIKPTKNSSLNSKSNQRIDHCECLVRFKDLETVERVLKLTNAKFDGQVLKIEKSKEECNIFVGNLKKLWSESHVNNLFRCRLKQITSIKFLLDPNSNNKNRGFCFLKFDNPKFAKIAFENLSKNPFVDDQLLSIDWADEYDSDSDIDKTQIHISGITPIIKSEELYRVFSQYGHIEQMKLSRDFENKSRTDYGFIRYSSEKEAESAIKEFDYKDYFPIPLKVQYARKISAIINHKKRTENSSSLLKKKRKDSNYSEESDSIRFNSNTKHSSRVNQSKSSSRNIPGRDKYQKHDFNKSNELDYNPINPRIPNNISFKNNPINNSHYNNNNQNILPLNNNFVGVLNPMNSIDPRSQNINIPNLIQGNNKILNNIPNEINHLNNNYNLINNANLQPNNSIEIGNLMTSNRQANRQFKDIDPNNFNANNNLPNLNNNQQGLLTQTHQINQLKFFNPNEVHFDQNQKINMPLNNLNLNLPIKNQSFNPNQLLNVNNQILNKLQNQPDAQFQQNSYLINDVRNQPNKNPNTNAIPYPNEIYNHPTQPSPANNLNYFNNNTTIPLNKNNQAINLNANIPQSLSNNPIYNNPNNNFNQMNQSINPLTTQRNPAPYNQNLNPIQSNTPMMQNAHSSFVNQNQNVNFRAPMPSGFQQKVSSPFNHLNNAGQTNPVMLPNQNLNFAGNNNFNFPNGFPDSSNSNPHLNPHILKNNNLTGNSDSNFKSNDYLKQPTNLNYHFKY